MPDEQVRMSDFELDLDMLELEFEKDLQFMDRQMGDNTRPFGHERATEENQKALHRLALRDPNVMSKLEEEHGPEGIRDWLEHMGNIKINEALE